MIRKIFVPTLSAPFRAVVEVNVNGHVNARDPKAMQSYLEKLNHGLEAYDRELTPDVLECSSASPQPIGKALSAFNMKLSSKSGKIYTVESVYQGSKVFEGVGCHHDWYGLSPQAAKKAVRTCKGKNVIGFNFFGREMPAEPRNAFYNWLWLNTFVRADWSKYPHDDMFSKYNECGQLLGKYGGFADIFFAKNGVACQAEAAAIACGMNERGVLNAEYLKDWQRFYREIAGGE